LTRKSPATAVQLVVFEVEWICSSQRINASADDLCPRSGELIQRTEESAGMGGALQESEVVTAQQEGVEGTSPRVGQVEHRAGEGSLYVPASADLDCPGGDVESHNVMTRLLEGKGMAPGASSDVEHSMPRSLQHHSFCHRPIRFGPEIHAWVDQLEEAIISLHKMIPPVGTML
jgi:hypothetical protein